MLSQRTAEILPRSEAGLVTINSWPGQARDGLVRAPSRSTLSPKGGRADLKVGWGRVTELKPAVQIR